MTTLIKSMRIWKLAGHLAFATLGSVALSGCGAIENAIDCGAICGNYKTCYDKDYDTTSCETRCRDNANANSDYMEKANACKGCLDNNQDCASITFNCGTACRGLVP